MSDGDTIVDHVTCLGCGCSCDDISVVVRAGRIAEARRACSLGTSWFGDGTVPSRVLSRGREASLEQAVGDAAALLSQANRALVYLAADVSCEVQRAGVGLADRLHGVVDTITSSTAREGILAAQRRGRAGATLGEIRNRADMIVFWGVDPTARYPRYTTRYAPEPEGVHRPRGRRDRVVIAVDVGDSRGPADADLRFAISPDEEVGALALLRAVLLGRGRTGAPPTSLDVRAASLATRLTAAAYVTIVHDAEPAAGRDPRRSDALFALADTLNGPTRCALSTLRAGGNRSGADAVLTWQTGYPMMVDFTRGVPRYRPDDGAAALLERGELDATLVLGAAATVPDDVRAGLDEHATVVIGPRATTAPFGAAVEIDTGVAGIHEPGMAIRLDDVPLPLRPPLPSPRDIARVVRELSARLPRPATVLR